MPRNGVPDRWMEYSPIGERIEGTKFIAFKVPLREGICRKIPPGDWFTPQMLITKVPKLGLIIDLTNTTRYYDPKEFQDSSVQYKKIFCQGHAIPNDAVTDQFFSSVDEFFESNKDDKIVGVHCTHGLNRTGYLICKYMIKKLGFTSERAISAFQKARGYSIERDLYLQNLRELDGKYSEEQIPEIASVPNINFKTSDDRLLDYGGRRCMSNSGNSRPEDITGINYQHFHVPNRSASTTDHRPRDYKNHASNYWYPPPAYHNNNNHGSPSKFYDDFDPSSEFPGNHESNSWHSFSEHPSERRHVPNDRDHSAHFWDARISTNSVDQKTWNNDGQNLHHPWEQSFYSGHMQGDRRTPNPRYRGGHSSRYSPY